MIDHFPTPVKNPGGLFTTGNSRKQIPGRWDTITHTTALGELTQDNIEHDLLRARYKEPLVHMALVCASKSCPPLRGEPFYADQMDDQLVDQARDYLASRERLVLDGETVGISSIFDWFGSDFVERYGSPLEFVERYAPDAVRQRVSLAVRNSRYFRNKYDWTLNEQDASSPKP